jgi:DNA-binding transcriptional LysR family regulator
MNLRHLEMFRAVMRTGSFTEAARLLGVSQPAVSKMLRETERQLGLALFERKSGRIVPSAEARALHAAVEKVFFDVEHVRLLAEELQDPLRSRLRIGAIPTATMTLVPQVVAGFRRRHPDVKMEVYALPTQHIIDGVVTGDLDLGLAYSVRDHPAVEAVELAETRIVCAMRPDHPLARQQVVTAEQLRDHAYISFRLDEPISLTIIEGFRSAGVKCAPAMVVSHSFTACALAEQGAGVALVTQFITAGGMFRNLVMRPLRPELRLQPRILLGRDRPRRPGIDEIIADIRRLIATTARRGRA